MPRRSCPVCCCAGLLCKHKRLRTMMSLSASTCGLMSRENSNFFYEGVTVSAGCAERVAVQDAVRDARIHSAGGPHRQQVLQPEPDLTLVVDKNCAAPAAGSIRAADARSWPLTSNARRRHRPSPASYPPRISGPSQIIESCCAAPGIRAKSATSGAAACCCTSC